MSSSGASYWNREYAGSMLFSLPWLSGDSSQRRPKRRPPLSKTLKRPRLASGQARQGRRWRRPNLSVQRA